MILGVKCDLDAPLPEHCGLAQQRGPFLDPTNIADGQTWYSLTAQYLAQ